MDTDQDASWRFVCPGTRLVMTVALGVLGAAMMPCQEMFLGPGSGFLHGWQLALWLTATVVGACFIHRQEGTPFPRSSQAILGFAVVMLLLCPDHLLKNAGRTLQTEGNMIWVMILLMAASMSVIRRLGTGRSDIPWMTGILHGPAIAVLAPLLLYRARPSPGGRCRRYPFDLFLVLLFFGFTASIAVDWLGQIMHGLHHLERMLTPCMNAWFSWSRWTWMGCGLLFLCCRWPEASAAQPKPHHRTRITWVVGTIVTVLAIPLLLIDRDILLFILLPVFHLFGSGVVFLLALLLTPGGWWRSLPRPPGIPNGQYMAPGWVGLLMGAAMGMVLPHLMQFLEQVVSGNLFLHHFHVDSHYGGNQQIFAYSAIFALHVLPCILVIRWLTDRQTRIGCIVHSFPTACLCLTLACMWFERAGDAWAYYHAMGFTWRRVAGMGYGALACLGTIAFAIWACWPPAQDDPR